MKPMRDNLLCSSILMLPLDLLTALKNVKSNSMTFPLKRVTARSMRHYDDTNVRFNAGQKHTQQAHLEPCFPIPAFMADDKMLIVVTASRNTKAEMQLIAV